MNRRVLQFVILGHALLLSGCSAGTVTTPATDTPPLHVSTNTVLPTTTDTTLPSTVTFTPSPTHTFTPLPPSATFTLTPSETPTVEAGLGTCTINSAGSSDRSVRFTIVNASGFEVQMKLEGQDINACYFLDVPAGNLSNPMIKVFIVYAGKYNRKTLQCNGVLSGGNLDLQNNIRLSYKSCEISTPSATATP